MTKNRSVLIGCALLALTGCGGLQEVWEGPSADTFRPKTIAVLPPIVGTYEGARELSHAALSTALTKTGRYVSVIAPSQVVSAFTLKESSDTLAAYYSKLETTGQSDPEMASKIGKLVQAEALLVMKVNNWEHSRAEGENYGKVGLGLRLIDASNGAMVWKARHDKVETYSMFKPALKDIAEDLSKEMAKHMPR